MNKYPISPLKKSLDILIDLSRSAQLAVSANKFPSARKYLNEICTIKMATSRGSGHTTAALDLMYEGNMPSIYVSPTQSILRHSQKMYRQKYEDAERHMWVNIDCINSFRGISHVWQNAIFDVSSLMPNSKKEQLLDILEVSFVYEASRSFFIIFLE